MKQYQIIYADPPWSFHDKINAATNGREITAHYPTMSNQDILDLPVKEMADKNCLLFMWVVYGNLPLALDVIKAWGFEYVTVAFEWLKLTETGKPVCFMGKWVCGGAIELCLLARRGTVKRIRKDVRRLVESPRTNHSRKPPIVRKLIVELLGDLPRVELFARKEDLLFDADGFDGWDVWGNECESDIEFLECQVNYRTA